MWWSWIEICVLIFLLVKSWQLFSGHLLFFTEKCPDVLRTCPNITLSGLLYWTLRQSDASFCKVVRFLFSFFIFVVNLPFYFVATFFFCDEFSLLFCLEYFILLWLFCFVVVGVSYCNIGQGQILEQNKSNIKRENT